MKVAKINHRKLGGTTLYDTPEGLGMIVREINKLQVTSPIEISASSLQEIGIGAVLSNLQA